MRRKYYYTHNVKKSNRLGPEPWRPSGEAEQTPAERVLAALAEQVGPVTTAELVSAVGLHSNTVRAHLQDLTEAGLVRMETVVRAGRGRPAHRYSITDEGRAVPRVNDPAFAEYRGLTTAFATYLASRSDNPSGEAREIGRAWGRQLSDDADHLRDDADPDPTGMIMQLLARLGFTPAPPPATQPEEGIALRTCPLLELAEEMPEVICQVHQGLIEGALDQAGASDVGAELLPFAEPGACRLHLRP